MKKCVQSSTMGCGGAHAACERGGGLCYDSKVRNGFAGCKCSEANGFPKAWPALTCTAAQLAEIEAGESLNEGTYEDSQNESGGSSAGIVVGCLAGVAVVAAAGAVVYKRRAAQSSLPFKTSGVPAKEIAVNNPAAPTAVPPTSGIRPLPPNWHRVKDEASGNFYFWNERTDATSWDRPTN